MQNVAQKNFTYEDVKNTVYEVIAEVLSVKDKETITRDTGLVLGLGADSVQWLEIFINIDSKLGIHIPELEWEQINTVGDLLSTVCKLMHIEVPDKDPQPFVKQNKKTKTPKVHKESTTTGATVVHKNSGDEQTNLKPLYKLSSRALAKNKISCICVCTGRECVEATEHFKQLAQNAPNPGEKKFIFLKDKTNVCTDTHCPLWDNVVRQNNFIRALSYSLGNHLK